MRVDELVIAFHSPDKAYFEQLCDNLVGKGLLIRDIFTGYDSGGETLGYHKAEYIDRLVKYIRNIDINIQ
jgi:hypothetical protein